MKKKNKMSSLKLKYWNGTNISFDLNNYYIFLNVKRNKKTSLKLRNFCEFISKYM